MRCPIHRVVPRLTRIYPFLIFLSDAAEAAINHMAGDEGDQMVASLAVGFTLGFGLLTVWEAIKQTRRSKNPRRSVYIYMIWYAFSLQMFSHDNIEELLLTAFCPCLNHLVLEEERETNSLTKLCRGEIVTNCTILILANLLFHGIVGAT